MIQTFHGADNQFGRKVLSLFRGHDVADFFELQEYKRLEKIAEAMNCWENLVNRLPCPGPFVVVWPAPSRAVEVFSSRDEAMVALTPDCDGFAPRLLF